MFFGGRTKVLEVECGRKRSSELTESLGPGGRDRQLLPTVRGAVLENPCQYRLFEAMTAGQGVPRVTLCCPLLRAGDREECGEGLGLSP